MTRAMPRPTATIAIGVVTTIVSALVILSGLTEVAAYQAGFIPARLSVGGAVPAAVPAILTPFSAALLHGGWLHLLSNMVMLAFLGARIEPVFGARGAVLSYLAGAVLAAAGQYVAAPHGLDPMIGASGAISAWFAMNALLYGQGSRLTRSPALNRAITALWLLAAWIVLQWMTEQIFADEGVTLATPAHVGGFVAGLLLQRPLLRWRMGRAYRPRPD